MVKTFKSIMMIGFVLLIVTISKPVMALGLGSFTDVPNFSVVIGASMFTLDYANNPTNANQISAAIAENKGDVFIKTDDTGWIKNSDGTQVNQDSVDISTIKYNNGQEIVASVPTAPSIVISIKVNPTIRKTGLNTGTFIYKIIDQRGIDITNTTPASELSVTESVSSNVVLDPATGIGTITFDSSTAIDTAIYVTLIDNKDGVIGTSSPSSVNQITVNPTITKTGLNTATFVYKIISQRGMDITSTIPASELSVHASVSSTIVLDPTIGIGTITYNSLTDIDKAIITLTDNNDGITGTSAPLKVANIDLDNEIVKTGLNTATFQYTLLDINNSQITDIPTSELSAIASVSSTIVLDPATGMGTITYNNPTDMDTSISITVTDKITGATGSSVMIAPIAETEKSRISKITITSTGLNGDLHSAIAYFLVYDQYGNEVTDSFGNNVIFKSDVGTITSLDGILTITANAGVDFSTLSSVVITGTDPVTGFSATFTLPVYL